jgi:hypothetical protein
MSLIGVIPLLGVLGVSLLTQDLKTKDKVEEPIPIILVYSENAANQNGYIIVTLKNGDKKRYTMLTKKDESISDYAWNDKEIIYNGLMTDITSRKYVNRDY